ncbi:hypothetical protein PHYBOEH_010564 [Phytophthora boehmeriae]|uniref:PWWP domain-containing protein n=1 Tax=Phytophthora boehmeriae TaxID=109152 RepID=A0A8T1X3U8_9STRA|nr:hypothetical protein PHYBOEH_010564 [Phytophthora boehmeriae]
MKPKRSPRSPRRTVALTQGDWLDVMDIDGVWNVARVLSVPSPEEVEVTYDGWPKKHNEVVRVDCDRVAPYHTFTWAVKCWVKYLNWPLWPSVITIRTPGNEEGIENLAMEDRLYVDFLDDPVFGKRDRCWQKKRQVRTFDDNYDKNRMGMNGAQFEKALSYALQSDSTTKMPKFAQGTLPLQYKNSTTESVEQMRKAMGSALWYRNFANNKERHHHTHIYDEIGIIKVQLEEDTRNDESALSDDSVSISNVKTKNEAKKTSRTKGRKKKKKKRVPAPENHSSVEIVEPPVKIEVPCELDVINSSDDSGLESEESDDNGLSDGFDPGATSEDKATSPPDSQTSSGDMLIMEDASVRSTVLAEPTPDDMISEEKLPRARSTSSKGPTQANIKLVAKRSTPPLGVNLNTSTKLRDAHALDHEYDGEDEEKGVPRDLKEDAEWGVSVHEKSPTQQRSTRTRKNAKQKSKPLALIDQCMEDALRVLNDAREKAAEAERLVEPN